MNLQESLPPLQRLKLYPTTGTVSQQTTQRFPQQTNVSTPNTLSAKLEFVLIDLERSIPLYKSTNGGRGIRPNVGHPQRLLGPLVGFH